jgi:hypothetical protein
VEEWAVEWIYSQGVWEEDAKSIVQAAKAHPAFEPWTKRWNDPMSGYPPQIEVALAMCLGRVAYEWIGANHPNAWYRAVFAPVDAATTNAA